MTPPPLPCGRCGGPLPWAAFNTPARAGCPSCGSEAEVVAFPALLREPEQSRPGEALLVEDQASCYYHPGRAAAVPCDGCGRFLCSLCDLPVGGEHLCPGCLEAGRGAGGGLRLQRRRTLWDSVALGFAVLPTFLWFITFVTAPAAVYLGLRHWGDARLSPVPRTRVRNVFAVLIGGAQLAGWATVLFVWLT